MNKFKKEHEWYFGSHVTWIFKTSGVYGMYCSQVRHRWFGIPGIIGIRFTKSWGSDL